MGSVALEDGVNLVGGTRDLVLSAACSLREPQPVYRAGANREAADLLKQMRAWTDGPGQLHGYAADTGGATADAVVVARPG